MQVLELKTAADFADSDVPEGKLLVWPENTPNGVVWRYKSSDGTVGLLGGGGGVLFMGSLVNAAVTRGHGGSGGPGAGLDAMPPAVLAVDENTIFDHNQSIL